MTCFRRRNRAIEHSLVPILTMALLTLFVACSSDDGGDGSTDPEIKHPEDFFPTEIGGLSADGAPSTATTAGELRDLIDGGYEIYTNHNFQEFAEQDYVGTIGTESATLTAWIFELATTEDAQELYDDPQVDTGNCSDWPGLGDQSRQCLSFGSQAIQFQRANYWVQMTVDDTSADAETILGLLGAHIDQEITD